MSASRSFRFLKVILKGPISMKKYNETPARFRHLKTQKYINHTRRRKQVDNRRCYNISKTFTTRFRHFKTQKYINFIRRRKQLDNWVSDKFGKSINAQKLNFYKLKFGMYPPNQFYYMLECTAFNEDSPGLNRMESCSRPNYQFFTAFLPVKGGKREQLYG